MATWGRMTQIEGMAEGGYTVPGVLGTARRPVWLECNEQGKE